MSIVQIASAITNQAANQPPSTHSISKAFTSNNTAGNAIIVAAFANCSNGTGGGITTPISVTDTPGNTYTQVISRTAGNNNGAAVMLYYATGILAGANTVTWTFKAPVTNTGINFTVESTILIAEASGLGAFTVQASTFAAIFGSAGNSPTNLTITNSHSTSVTVKIAGGIGSAYPNGGIGTINTGALLVDLLTGSGDDYLIAAAFAQDSALNAPTISTGGTVPQETKASDATNGYYGYFWDGIQASASTPRPFVYFIF